MYLNKKQLIERGWSLKLIARFLGKPDDVHRLGRYCEEHLYFLPRVERLEKADEYVEVQAKTRLRRQRGKESARRQAAERLEQARTIIIRVRRLSDDELLEAAVEHFNFNRRGHWRRCDDDYIYDEFTPADKSSDSAFLDRITVNYVRHELTSYDGKLRAQKGKIGGGDAVPIIRRRVFEEIICAYPKLEDECFRQMLSRGLITEIEVQNRKKAPYEQLELPF